MERKRHRSEFARRGEIKAIALLSGGLDSTLAAALVKRAGVTVIGLYVKTLFGSERDRAGYVIAAAEALRVPLRQLDLSEAHLEIVRRPKHGVGAGMNPCLDCRILMLEAAKRAMEEEGGQFVVTGEVLGQRPMTQHRRALEFVARESGLADRLLRPLSARLLPTTLPIREGWINPEDLPEICGRGRSAQIDLAARLGIREYPQPAGGCLLADKSYAARLRDAFAHIGRDAMTLEDFRLLRYGRQFRLSERTKVIVGRNEEENAALRQFAASRIAVEPITTVGPLALIEGKPSPKERDLALSLAARYCDQEGKAQLKMRCDERGEVHVTDVVPLGADDPRLRAWRIDEGT